MSENHKKIWITGASSGIGKALAEKFAYGIAAAAETLHEPQIHSHLTTQSNYTQIYYSWPKQASAWTTFLKGAINVKSK